MSKELNWFVYDPEDGISYWPTEEKAAEVAGEYIESYMDDGWSDEVEQITMGLVTHRTFQTDYRERPDDLDEEGCDGEGNYWDPDWASMCNYKLKPSIGNLEWEYVGGGHGPCGGHRLYRNQEFKLTMTIDTDRNPKTGEWAKGVVTYWLEGRQEPLTPEELLKHFVEVYRNGG